ncbi:MAG: RtcB family protein [Cytophagales bacterium]|nr:RtcB family protein [Cytophagales bacterium]
MYKKITTFGEVDERALQQLKNCSENADYAVLCADHHPGYSQPIGGAIAYENHISPSGVGYDIACGNKAVMTDIDAKDIDLKNVMDELFKQIGFGVGRPNPKPVDHPVFDKIAKAEFKPQKKLLNIARAQLGTVGGGNHYVDLFEDDAGKLWIGVHFGSRGFGNKTANGFLALAQGKEFGDRVKDVGMDSPPVLIDVRNPMGQDYIEAMHLAGDYAYAGRDVVVKKVLEILRAKSLYEVHNHHNFAWREEHFEKKYWIIRKGCTPAYPEQKGFVGSTMEDISVILEGVDSARSKESLYSTVHGAGRVMSRRKAAGKTKWVRGKDGIKRPMIVSKGLVNFPAVLKRMKRKGIELRGSGPDEAPEVYKSLDQVLEYHKDTIKILHKLKPIGVAMAGLGVYDPYKD